MKDFTAKNPYMDYRDTVPFVNLSGFIVKQPKMVDELPVKSLQEYLKKKKFSTMINLRRFQYCRLAEEYRNGKR